MNPVLIGQFEPGTKAWENARRRHLGGSEIAAVLGLSPWESWFTLWHRKQGIIPSAPDNPNMDWGRRLEPVIAQKFLDNHPEYGRYLHQGYTYVHPDRGWQSASPDLLMVETSSPPAAQSPTVLLEVKTSAYGNGFGPSGTDEIPIYYRTQVLWYADVLGIDVLWVAVLIAGHDYREYQITVDDAAREEMRVMRESGYDFMQAVFNKDVPDIDRHTATYQAVRQLHPDIEPGEVVVPDDLAVQFQAAVLDMKRAKHEKEYVSAQIMNAMGVYRDAIDSTGTRFAYRRASKFEAVPFLCPDYRNLPQLAPSAI